jgi:hypothetical protein
MRSAIEREKKTKINQNVIHRFFYFNLVLPDCEFFVKSETTRFSFCLAKQNADAIFFFFFRCLSVEVTFEFKSTVH